jgi:hypothetical protein
LAVSRHIVPLIGGLGGVPLQASPAPGAYGAITGAVTFRRGDASERA